MAPELPGAEWDSHSLRPTRERAEVRECPEGPGPAAMLAAPMSAARALAAGLCALLCACGGEEKPAPTPAPASAQPSAHPDGPPRARWDTVDAIRESLAAHNGPADGGGRAWLERDGQPPYTLNATPDRFNLVYEAGPLGVATGGTVFLQISPFWDWSTPQVEAPDQRGYTTVTASDPAIQFRAETLDQQLLGIEITGRPLVQGDRLTIVYGAGIAGAMTDRYAERKSPFWFAVDGDGDGTRKVLEDSPTIDVHPGKPAGLLFTVPTVVRPGESFRVTLAFIDAWRNDGVDAEGEVQLVDVPKGIELPETVRFARENEGRRHVEGVAREPGTYRLHARVGKDTVTSNPMVVTPEGPKIYWGDLHGHSNFSDGTGLPEDYFIYARDVSGLDVSALTDHDHWGMLPLYSHPEMWQEIQKQTKAFHEPGRFVTILGYEWTSWIYGHRHVLYFGDSGPVYPWSASEYETPTQLWDALAKTGLPLLTFAHHSAGDPIPTDWTIPPDPRFEPVTEIVSIHGASEAADAPNVITHPLPGNFVRDALDRGYRLGFVGSGDRHDGHPGAYQIDPQMGGLAAILADELTREGVLAALRAKRVYATNGPRMLLRMALGSHRMGESVSVAEAGKDGKLTDKLFVHVIAETPLEKVDFVRSGRVEDTAQLAGELEVMLDREVRDLASGEYVYVRAVQKDGGAVWSSPIFLVD